MANTTYGTYRTYVFRQDQTYADTRKRLLAPGFWLLAPGAQGCLTR